MKISFRDFKIVTKLFTGFTIILIVILTIILVAHSNSGRIIESTFMIIHTQEVLTDLAEVEAKLIDLETGQRGFIITGRPNYLEPYNSSLKIINSKINNLEKLTSDNDSQTKRIHLLREMVDLKLDELNNTIELRQQENGFEMAKEIIITDEGKILMDSIRSQITAIKGEELRLMNIRSKAPDKSRTDSDSILVSLLLFSVLVSIAIAIITSRSITRPIKLLQRGTVIVGQGNLSHQLGINTKDEIGQLSQSFESMLDKLKTTMASKDVLEKEIEIRKQTEDSLLQAKGSLEKSESELIESNNSKDKFFSIIAHDLKSPFNSMLGFSDLLNDHFDEFSKEEQKNYLGIIHTNIENTLKLLNNLLIWSCSQSGSIDFNPEEANLFLLSNTIIDLVELSADSKSITIKSEIPKDILVNGDRNMLSIILRNLITNAIKFTPEEGEITLIAELKRDNKDIPCVEIIIKDNGVGMSDDIQSKLFDIGQSISTIGTANEKGTGLGLHLCKEFVEKHNGRIWVKSEEGKGSSFHFTLPNASYIVS